MGDHRRLFSTVHGRILENLLGKEKLVQFDTLSRYKKYTDVFDIDTVPEEDRMELARDVANWVLDSLNSKK